MTSPTRRRPPFRVVSTLILVLSGFLMLPVLAFIVGQAVVGPYEGDGGFAGYLGTIVADIGRGKLGALALVTTPAANDPEPTRTA